MDILVQQGMYLNGQTGAADLLLKKEQAFISFFVIHMVDQSVVIGIYGMNPHLASFRIADGYDW